jgi:hypothetical protein
MVWLGSVVAAFVVGSMVGGERAQGDSAAGGLEGRVAALEAWKASAGVFTQDQHAPEHPWTFAPPYGDVVIRSVSSYSIKVNGDQENAGKVTIAAGRSGGSNESMLRIDGTMGSEQMFLKAAKDLDVRVTNQEREQVDSDVTRKLGKRETVSVAQDQTITAGGNLGLQGQNVQVTGSSSVTVNGRRM